MSRIGRKPIPIASGVKVETRGSTISVTGPKGTLSATVHESVSVVVKDNQVVVSRTGDGKSVKALHGLWRALINNMMTGVTRGFQRKLEIVGVGYKAELKGKRLQLALGYSHPIVFSPPEGIKLEVPQPTNITISGSDKQLVGQIAAKIRSFRLPEPYKGKGIKYEGETIRRKAGKAAATVGAK